MHDVKYILKDEFKVKHTEKKEEEKTWNDFFLQIFYIYQYMSTIIYSCCYRKMLVVISSALIYPFLQQVPFWIIVIITSHQISALSQYILYIAIHWECRQRTVSCRQSNYMYGWEVFYKNSIWAKVAYSCPRHDRIFTTSVMFYLSFCWPLECYYRPAGSLRSCILKL